MTYHQNVSSKLTALQGELSSFQTSLKEELILFIQNNEWEEIDQMIHTTSKVSTILSKVSELHKEWEGLSSYVKDNTSTPEIEWELERGNIRIITRRNNSEYPYKNIFNFSLFKDIVNHIVTILNLNSYVKTSDIASDLKDKIIGNSNYVSTYRTPVFLIIKLLHAEGFLMNKHKNKHQYIYTNKNAKEELLKWMKENFENCFIQ
jgi:hypothetical protein